MRENITGEADFQACFPFILKSILFDDFGAFDALGTFDVFDTSENLNAFGTSDTLALVTHFWYRWRFW